MKYTLLFLYCFIGNGLLSFGQSNSIDTVEMPKMARYKSQVYRIEVEDKNTGKWLKSDTLQNHLVVVDFSKKKITVYSDTKEKELDIIFKFPVSKKGRASDYTYRCVDEENIVCLAIVAFLDDTILYISLDYSKYKLTYIIL